MIVLSLNSLRDTSSFMYKDCNFSWVVKDLCTKGM